MELAAAALLAVHLATAPVGNSALPREALPGGSHADSGPPASGTALVCAGVSLALLGSGAAGYFTGTLLPSAAFRAQGRPDPLALGGGLVVGTLAGALVSQLLAPEVVRFANGPDWSVPPGEVRLEGWRRARWAVLGSGVSVGVYFAGALQEREQFGRGSVSMLVGLSGVVVFAIAYAVLELWGILRGWQQGATPPGSAVSAWSPGAPAPAPRG